MEYANALSALICELGRAVPSAALVRDYPMAEHTTMRVGGNADLAVVVETSGDLCRAARLCRRFGVRHEVIGRGSNLLCRDEGFRGVVLVTEKLNQLNVCGSTIRASCGVSLNALSRAACDASLSGAEFLFGIPGSVGGALYMNAGAYGGQIGDICMTVDFYDEARDMIVTVPAAACRFGYRDSIFMRSNDLVALSCTVQLTPSDRESVAALMQTHIEARKAKQPLEYPSAGSFFKRCEGRFTAQLIDEAGLKGLSVGGAQISEKHAGFLINRDHATCADILALADRVHDVLKERYGIDVQREVELLD